MPGTDQVVALPGPSAAPGSTILAVDDNPVNLQLLVRTLEGRGHRILAAKSGRAALDIARRAEPDLVLLDVVMPDMSGFDVCRQLKADPVTRNSLVIFLSALQDVADKVEGLRLGAVDYVTKPIQPEEVLARVDTHLTRQYLERELRRSRDRLDRELAGAARMQQLLLPPTLPRLDGLHVAAHYQTSRHAGGDYYDVVRLDDDRHGLIVADVSGHGAPAAIIMAMIRAVFHSYPGPLDDPGRVLMAINDHFRFLRDTAVFATAVYAVVDRRERTLRLACAGHPPPLLFRPGTGVAVLPCASTIPLLFADLAAIDTTRHALQPGDRVLIYTDGVTDRQTPAGELYDLERLVAVLERAGGDDAPGVLQQIVCNVESFANLEEASDDQTLLLLAID
jgi:sigma-B regulation protein RsbU (phosphoserine phosphatase)